jgi:hypothetical protein
MKRTLASKIASLVDARARCLATGNTWAEKHESRLHALIREFLPSGSGFDNGSTIYLDQSSADKIVLATSFHHMDENGSYDGWTDHKVTVKPSLVFGFTLTVSGRNRNDMKDYIAETFEYCLSQELTLEREREIYERLAD